MRTVPVVVVGGGMAGAASAWALARRGVGTLLLEQHAAGHDRGSSHGAGRIVRLAYPDPFYVRLAQRAYAGWEEIQAAAGRHLVTATGGVDHGDPGAIAQIAAALAGAGVGHEVLDPAEAGDRWPAMRFAGPVLYQPDSGVVDAGAAVAAFAAAAVDLGAEVRYAARVRTLVQGDGGVLVTTDEEEILAETCVVAAGAWLPRLLPEVSLPPLTVTDEQPVFFTPPGELPVFIHYAPQDAGRAFAAYGLVSGDEGLKVGEHRAGPVVDPDARPEQERPDATAAVVRYVEEWLPGVDPSPVGTTRCLYTTTPSEDFLIDRTGPMVVVSPCSGHGFKFAPVVGELVADAVAGRTALSRFALGTHLAG